MNLYLHINLCDNKVIDTKHRFPFFIHFFDNSLKFNQYKFYCTVSYDSGTLRIQMTEIIVHTVNHTFMRENKYQVSKMEAQRKLA